MGFYFAPMTSESSKSIDFHPVTSRHQLGGGRDSSDGQHLEICGLVTRGGTNGGKITMK